MIALLDHIIKMLNEGLRLRHRGFGLFFTRIVETNRGSHRASSCWIVIALVELTYLFELVTVSMLAKVEIAKNIALFSNASHVDSIHSSVDWFGACCRERVSSLRV